jgi:hypothetical protein
VESLSLFWYNGGSTSFTDIANSWANIPKENRKKNSKISFFITTPSAQMNINAHLEVKHFEGLTV